MLDRRSRRARKRTKKFVKFFVLCIGIPVFVASAVFFFFFSRFFAIDRIDVSASGGIDPQDVRSVLFKKMDERKFVLASNGNIFLFDIESALEALKNSFAVDEISITRRFPITVEVVISGKPFSAFWCTQGACYALFADGSVSRQVDVIAMGADISKLPALFHSTSTSQFERKKQPAAPALEIPLLVDEKNDPIPQDHSPRISSAALAVVRDMARQLSEKKIGISHIRTHSTSADTTAVTREGWDILFTPFEDARGQIENLTTVLDTKIKSDRKRLKYVDVRFQNHIYYTFR
ncbi:hypothetical protein HYW94_01030 [Candidatus Uhrbacteria bacterium]|nr:hypothetical protein [Candidatus Uhrbacteria bacterium]